MTARRCALFVAGFALVPVLAFAQGGANLQQGGAAPANLTFGPVAQRAIDFVFDLSKDDKKGTAAIGWNRNSEQFRVTLSGPLSKGTTEPLTLDGLAPGAEIGFQWHTLRTGRISGLEKREADRMCEELNVELGRPAGSDCLNIHFPDAYRRGIYEDLRHLNAPGWLWGAEGALSRSDFEFLDDSLEPQEDSHLGRSVTGRFARVDPHLFTVFVSYTRSLSYKAGSAPVNLCRPREGTTASECGEAVLKEPAKVSRSVLSLEVRRFFSASFAISPAFKWDFIDDFGTVEVPIYFIGKGNSATGGLRINYRTDKGEVKALFFIGGALGLIP